MEIVFENGTAQQVAWFTEAMGDAVFPWDRIEGVVTVRWVDVVSGGANDFAYTNWGAAGAIVDPCGRPAEWRVEIRHDLDDPNRTQGGPQYRGKKFYMETVVHELGHVVQSKLSEAQILALVQMFGGTERSEWDAPPWDQMRQESFAETFKDVWLPRADREFDNRTAHKLGRADFDRFLEIFDGICPCESDAGPSV